MPSASHTNFVLPGIRNNPAAKMNLIYSVIHAYSTMSNRRRLENPLYALWGEILNLLVADLKDEIIVCPQYAVYRASKENPNVSMATEADNTAYQRTPDFSLLGVILVDRKTKELLRQPPSLSFQNWPDVQVAAWCPYALVELKKMAGRHFAHLLRFQSALTGLMQLAVLDVEAQARIVFWEADSDGPAYKAKTLILIAAVGEWWRFRIATTGRLEEPEPEGVKDNFFEDSDEDSSSDEEANNAASESKPAAVKTKTMRRWTTLDPKDLMEDVKNDAMDAMPKKWSKYILYGTPESNQRMYLIHQKLREMMQDLKPEALANSDRWKKDDGYDSDETDDEDPDAIVKYGTK